MPRTVVNTQNVPATNATAGTAVTWTASDVANGNMFVWNQDVLVVVRNSHATTSYTATFTGVADPYGRTGTIVDTLTAGQVRVYPFFPSAAWMQPTGSDAGKVYFNGENAAVEIALLRLGVR
jgi:hypothetical protein